MQGKSENSTKFESVLILELVENHNIIKGVNDRIFRYAEIAMQDKYLQLTFYDVAGRMPSVILQ